MLSYDYHGNYTSTYQGGWEKAKLEQRGLWDPEMGGVRI